MILQVAVGGCWFGNHVCIQTKTDLENIGRGDGSEEKLLEAL